MLRAMKTLLTAIDFSPITQRVLDEASKLALETGSRLVILHVVEPAAAYVPVGAAMDVITAPMPIDSPDLNVVKERLEQLAASLRSKGVTVETIVTVSLPVDAIIDQAKATGAGMLILGSHGHGAVFQLFSGSVVTSVLHKAEIPVIVIPVHGK